MRIRLPYMLFTLPLFTLGLCPLLWLIAGEETSMEAPPPMIEVQPPFAATVEGGPYAVYTP